MPKRTVPIIRTDISVTVLLAATLAISVGCTTATLTPEGAGIVAMWQNNSGGMLGNCDRLGTVVGNSDSKFGGAIGQPQAVANAKNEAATFAGADTVVFTNSWEDFSGSHINGVVYRCQGASAKTIVFKSEPSNAPSAAADSPPTNKYDDLAKLEKLRANGTITQSEFDAEKKKILAR